MSERLPGAGVYGKKTGSESTFHFTMTKGLSFIS